MVPIFGGLALSASLRPEPTLNTWATQGINCNRCVNAHLAVGQRALERASLGPERAEECLPRTAHAYHALILALAFFVANDDRFIIREALDLEKTN